MLNQITQIRLPNGTEVALVDWTDRPLYSTAEFQNGFIEQETDIFTYVIGGVVPGRSPAATVIQRTATLADTNIATPTSAASTEEMLVYAIKVELFMYNLDTSGDFTAIEFSGVRGTPNVSVAGLKEIQRRMVLQLFISQKVYSEAPLGYYNTGFGPSGVGTGPDNLGSALLVNQGLPSQEAVRSFVIPQHVGGQEKYYVNLANPTGQPVELGIFEGGISTTTMARMRVYLDGLYKRPVS